MKIQLSRFDNGSFYLPIPPALEKKLIAGGNKRVVCSFKNGEEIHVALQKSKEAGTYIYLGNSTMKKLKLKQGEKTDVEIRVDDSPYQFQMPEEFEEVLKTDPEADKIFHSLTPGNQRSIIHVVAAAKNSDTRVTRALKIAERLKQGVTNAMKILKKEI